MKTYKKVFTALWVVAIGLSVLVGINELRKQEDKITVSKINAASNSISDYARAQKKLPESLSELSVKDTSGLTYKKLDDTSYELCATFIAAIPGRDLSEKSSQIYVYAHKRGYQCFTAEPATLSTPTTSRQSTSTVASNQIRARDTERQTDIKALHGQIEAYYAQNGRYPTLINMNTTSFRSANMKGLDSEALKDPLGMQANLVARPTKNYYSYSVTSASGGNCDNTTNDCAVYVLTATLEAGGTYTKNSLN